MKLKRILLLAILPMATAETAVAQEANGLRPGSRHLSAYVAGSWSNRFGPKYSTIPSQPYGMLVGRVEYVLEAFGPVALSFYMEAIPAIVVASVPRYSLEWFWTPPDGPFSREKMWREPALVYGAGLTPGGLQVYANVSKTVSVFTSASGGVAWFTRDMPVPDARQLNFLADVGGGVRVTKGTGAFIAGLKFHHMSNANMGRQNPGIDGNVAYLGLSRRR